MSSDSGFEPVDRLVKEVLTPDRAAARRVAVRALAPAPPRPLPWARAAIAATVIVTAAAVGIYRSSSPEPAVVIRAEGSIVVIERGSGSEKTIETLRDEPATGSFIAISSGGDE